MDNPNKNQQFPQKTQVTPKCVNNTDTTRPTKKINKSSKLTNNIQPTLKIISETRDLMDVDSVDVTHHVRAQQQPISNTQLIYLKTHGWKLFLQLIIWIMLYILSPMLSPFIILQKPRQLMRLLQVLCPLRTSLTQRKQILY